jgi:hypothetical protein
MGINLSETAAEILKTSIGKNQEPTKKLPGNVIDLGGATPSDDYSGPDAPNGHGHGERDTDVGVGIKAAKAVQQVPKPAAKGDAKSAKVPSVPAMAEETSEEGVNLEDLSEEELDELLASLSEEEIAELEASLEISDEDAINELSEEELDELLASLSEEEIAALEEEIAQIDEISRDTAIQAYAIRKGTNSVDPDSDRTAKDKRFGKLIANKANRDASFKGAKSAGDAVARHIGNAGLADNDYAKTVYPGPKNYAKHKKNIDAVSAKLGLDETINVKELVRANMVSMQEDVDALFNGESLSEEFRTKARTIFEAAVQARVEAVVETVVVKNNEYLSETSDALRDNLAEQIDSYLNYVVEEWMTANQVAVESGLRGEIAEGFIKGLKGLFAEHYIEVPEDKIDLVDELATTVNTLENDLAEEVASKVVLQKSLNESKARESLRKICEGLTEVQIQKIKTLAEGVEFTTVGEYTEKLTVIRENYFPAKNSKSETPTSIVETADSSAEDIAPRMDLYVKAITKTNPV